MKRPGAQRIHFFLLITIQAATVAYMTGWKMFSLIAVVVALIGLAPWIQLEVTRKHKLNFTALLMVVFLLKALAAIKGIFSSPELPSTAYYASMAQFLIAFQVAHLFIKFLSGRLPAYTILLAILGMLFAGQRILPLDQQFVYRMDTICFAVLGIFFLANAPNRPLTFANSKNQIIRSGLIGLFALITCGLAWIGSEMAIGLERHSDRIFGFIYGGGAKLVDRSSSGFSSHPWFESIRHFKKSNENAIALRVYSQRPPGYLRGRAFTEVSLKRMGGWGEALPTHAEPPSTRHFENIPKAEQGENLFELRKDYNKWSNTGNNLKWWNLDIHPAKQIEDAIFSPLGSALLAAGLKTATVDTGSIPQSAEAPAGGNYRLFVPIVDQQEDLTSETLQSYLKLPKDVDPRISKLAAEVLQDTKTPSEKMQAVETYFHTNYQYELGVIYEKVPKGSDVITHFLLEKIPAHCEYFATGAAVLLRLGGVPCRYVNGFVAWEKNRYGDYWVARNRNAHAWVEAYDSASRTWQIVEATPASGVPSAEAEPTPSKIGNQWDALKFMLARVWSSIKSDGLKSIFSIFKAIKNSILHSPVLSLSIGAFLLALVLLWVIRKRRPDIPPSDPLNELAHRILGQMDRLLNQHGLIRSPSETLHQFACRIQTEAINQKVKPAAEWYRRYASIRYSGQMKEQHIELLQKECEKFK